MHSLNKVKPSNHTRSLLTASGIALAFLAAAAPARAQDKATLDLLVSKGVITQAEADKAAKSAATAVRPRVSDVKTLKLEGMIQTQFSDIGGKDNAKIAGVSTASPPATDQFLLRRVYLGADADFGNGWGGEIMLDFAATNEKNSATVGPLAPAVAGTGNEGQNLFEKVIITDKIPDYGTAVIGFQKVNFTQEENVATPELKVIERSISSRYFDENYDGVTTKRLGFADRHTGIFWNGIVPAVDGLYYGVAITNGIQNTNISTGSVGGTNKFAFWANGGYKNTVNDLSYKVGLNWGYSSDQNSVNGTPVTNASNAEWGYNPYVTLDYGKLELSAEFEQVSVQNGRIFGATTSTATPYGVNLTPSYKFNDQWEVAARYSILSSNGRGISPSDVDSNAPNPVGVALYNNAWSLYGGVNYYILGNSVKLSGGYEYTEFSDRQAVAAGPFLRGNHYDVGSLRFQVQVQF